MLSKATTDVLDRITRSGRLSEAALASIAHWLEDPELATFLPEIEALVREEQWEELEDAFYTHVRIGTGGIRGKLGPGPNRINLRTIGEAAQALSNFVNLYAADRKHDGIVVGHEARRNSEAFAALCCEVFAANGITAHRFDGMRATPEISFAVRHLKAVAGVQITASHNPRTDNGFKFYWSDGGQVVAPMDARFMEMVQEVREIRRLPAPEGEPTGQVHTISAAVDLAYIDAIRGLSLERSRSALIVFSPIHGAGTKNVLPVLQREGFHVITEPHQIEQNGNFPTAPGDLINPEYREVMDLPIALAEQTGADLALCSDPDADRLGVAAKVKLGWEGMQFLTGNQVGAALTSYLLSRRKAHGVLSEKDKVIETVVTTDLISDIARHHGLVPDNDLLVGFKFIAEIIEQLSDPKPFIFAAEESLGYLVGDFVRDKDAGIAALVVSEMTSWLKDQGKTLPDYLDDIYRTYGYYKNVQYMIELPGKLGFDIMTAVMRHLQANPPDEIAGMRTAGAPLDRLGGRDRSRDGYRLGQTGDILTFQVSKDLRSRITARPSGTEPKLKFYVQHYAPAGDDLTATKAAVNAAADAMARSLLDHCTSGVRERCPELLPDWLRAKDTLRVI